MGYDLHATRGGHWSHSTQNQITAAEWREVVTWDPDLAWDKSQGPLAVKWMDGTGTKRGWFDWYDGGILTTDPDRATVVKLLELAVRIGARVQGDGDEFYENIDDWDRHPRQRDDHAASTEHHEG